MKSDYQWDIEKKRDEMMKAAKEYGFTSDITIKRSQELDDLLNDYNKSLQKD